LGVRKEAILDYCTMLHGPAYTFQGDLALVTRGAWDVKNYMGYVNFFKNFQLIPPLPPKKETVSPKMEFFPLPHAVGFTSQHKYYIK